MEANNELPAPNNDPDAKVMTDAELKIDKMFNDADTKMVQLMGADDHEGPLQTYLEKVCEMLATRLETLTGEKVPRPLTESGIIAMLRTEGISKEAQQTIVQNAVMVFALDMATVLNPGRGGVGEKDEPDAPAPEEAVVPPSIPQIPLPDFKKWEDPISSQLDYDEAPDELPMDDAGITKHRSRILYFTDALVKKDDEKYGVICFDCIKMVKVDSWAKHASVGKTHLANAEQRRRKFGGVPDPDNADAGVPQQGNGRRRRKQAGRGIKHPTKQQILLLKKAIRRITR